MLIMDSAILGLVELAGSFSCRVAARDHSCANDRRQYLVRPAVAAGPEISSNPALMCSCGSGKGSVLRAGKRHPRCAILAQATKSSWQAESRLHDSGQAGRPAPTRPRVANVGSGSN
jgi:hypothetical protein